MSPDASAAEGRVFTVLSREWCHLCHDMIAALRPLADAYGWRIEILDVDADAALEARWNELVPVLLDGDMALCHWHLDAERVRRHCEARMAAAAQGHAAKD